MNEVKYKLPVDKQGQPMILLPIKMIVGYTGKQVPTLDEVMESAKGDWKTRPHISYDEAKVIAIKPSEYFSDMKKYVTNQSCAEGLGSMSDFGKK